LSRKTFWRGGESYARVIFRGNFSQEEFLHGGDFQRNYPQGGKGVSGHDLEKDKKSNTKQ